jgi:hypothetical protein
MAKTPELYIPRQQTKTIWFMKEGDESDQVELSVTIRADLLNDELETLVWPTKDDDGEPIVIEIDDVRERIAPFILDWNVGELRDGKPVKADPPAVAGGEALEAIADAYTWRLLTEIKMHNLGVVKPAFLPKSKRLEKPTPDGSVTAMTTSGKA